jgi:1-acyl-sn-glycerol-3-phosphate acyltransferase
MWNAVVDAEAPRYWPPRHSRIWWHVLAPWRWWCLRRHYGIAHIDVEGLDKVSQCLSPGDAVLLAPNHSHDSDPHVMLEVGRRLGLRLYFMAAWQLFRTHAGWDGFLLQRMGCFSVDREGCDRRAIQQAIELLTTGKTLVVFPEGEVYRLNERLTPLLDGVAFMALSAQRDLDREGNGRRVWIVPTAIRYRYVDDIMPRLAEAMDRLEARMLIKSPPQAPLSERIIRFGELLLTIKEKERLGHSCDTEGDLPTRVSRLLESLLGEHEKRYLERCPSAKTTPLRIKALRRHLLGIWTDETADEPQRKAARAALDDVHLVLQLYSYPGNYISQRPTVERMAETIEKFEEDIDGLAHPKGRRRAKVLLGEPIDLSKVPREGRPRNVAAQVTDRLEEAIEALLAEDV